jgi:hypothetical protein
MQVKKVHNCSSAWESNFITLYTNAEACIVRDFGKEALSFNARKR